MWHLPRRKKKHGVVLFFFFFFFFSSRRRTGTRHQPCQIYIGGWTHHTHKHLPAPIGYTKRGKEAWCAREMFKYIPTCPLYICRASAVPGTHLLGKKKKNIKTNSLERESFPTGIYIASERVTSASGLDTSAAASSLFPAWALLVTAWHRALPSAYWLGPSTECYIIYSWAACAFPCRGVIWFIHIIPNRFKLCHPSCWAKREREICRVTLTLVILPLMISRSSQSYLRSQRINKCETVKSIVSASLWFVRVSRRAQVYNISNCLMLSSDLPLCPSIELTRFFFPSWGVKPERLQQNRDPHQVSWIV